MATGGSWGPLLPWGSGPEGRPLGCGRPCLGSTPPSPAQGSWAARARRGAGPGSSASRRGLRDTPQPARPGFPVRTGPAGPRHCLRRFLCVSSPSASAAPTKPVPGRGRGAAGSRLISHRRAGGSRPSALSSVGLIWIAEKNFPSPRRSQVSPVSGPPLVHSRAEPALSPWQEAGPSP